MNKSEYLTTNDLVFCNSLVKAITGMNLDSIPDQSKSSIIENCLEIYQNYIIGYFKEHFDKNDIIRIQQVIKDGNTDLFNKFEDLNSKFDEAYQSFIQYIA